MKKLFLIGILLVCPLFVLLGCTNENINVKHNVAISSDSERIAYNVYGKGDVSLIFIHGWSCDSRYWKNQIPEFSKNYQVITVDLAGHGNSSLDRNEYTMLSFANDIKAVIEQEKINNAILIGHSSGGAIIAEAAKLMPKEIKGIIGIDTLQNVAEVLPKNVLNEMAKPFEADFKSAMQGFVIPMFPKDADKNLVNWVKEDMSSAPKEIALNQFYNYSGQYLNGESARVFQDVNVPVVSINARMWPTNIESNMKHIKDYKLFYIEEVGHFPMLENPDNFNELLTEAIEYIEA